MSGERFSGPVTEYRRIHHAAHTAEGGGWDLEEWDVVGSGWSPGNDLPLPDSVPTGAQYHHGYVDGNGRQHWVFTRRAMMGAGTCTRCAR